MPLAAKPHMPHTPVTDLDWDHLRFFLAAAETGSLSAAARRLRSNQPTVGRHIDALEAGLGLKLFQRHKQGLALTQEGALVLEQAQLMQAGAAGIARVAAGADREPRGSVRLAIPEGLCNEILIPHLDAFYRRYANIKLVLDVAPRLANVPRGEADIAIRLLRPREADLVARNLGRMDMGLYASRAYIKEYGRPASEAALGEHRIITYGDTLGGLEENQWLVTRSRPQNIVMQSDSTTARVRATEAGLGISVQPRMIADRNPKLVRLLKNLAPPAREIWITYHKDLRRVLRARAVVDFVSALVERTSVRN